MKDAMFVLTLVSAIGAGVVGGVFYAFSTFVMPALRRVPPTTGIVAMQSINRMAPTAPFMLAFIGTGVTCAALIVIAATQMGESGSALAILGGALYLLVIVVTAAYHVPRNDVLNTVDPAVPDADADWQRYLREWIPANHVRTVVGVAAATVLTCALFQQ